VRAIARCRRTAVIDRQAKYVFNTVPRSQGMPLPIAVNNELYDLRFDPREAWNRNFELASDIDVMHAALVEWWEQVPVGAAPGGERDPLASLPSDVRRILTEAGYLPARQP
jgi:hypothetical protein